MVCEELLATYPGLGGSENELVRADMVFYETPNGGAVWSASSIAWAAREFVDEKSLAAAEYLLFYGGTDNACSPSSAINGTGSWAALSADELATRAILGETAVTSRKKGIP